MNRQLVKHVEKPTRNFSQIPKWMLEGMGELSLLAHVLYLILYSQAPAFIPSKAGLARKIRSKGESVSVEAIGRAIKELKDSGYLEVIKTGFNSYEYHLYDRPYQRARESNEGA